MTSLCVYRDLYSLYKSLLTMPHIAMHTNLIILFKSLLYTSRGSEILDPDAEIRAKILLEIQGPKSQAVVFSDYFRKIWK